MAAKIRELEDTAPAFIAPARNADANFAKFFGLVAHVYKMQRGLGASIAQSRQPGSPACTALVHAGVAEGTTQM
jgi:hypothetical protein